MAPTVALPDGWEIVIPVLTGSKRKDSGSVETPGAGEDFAAQHASPPATVSRCVKAVKVRGEVPAGWTRAVPRGASAGSESLIVAPLRDGGSWRVWVR
jgi:hypothetical protein